MPPRHAYDLVAIDLDGTLLDPGGRLRPANIHAITRARHAGMHVTICTGRGLIECADILRAIEQTNPVVVAGGSMVACPRTAATLHRFPMERSLVARLSDCLLSHGHAVLILKDPHPVGHDYTILSPKGAAGLDPVTRWWFETMRITPRYISSLQHDEHPEHTVRVGVCGTRRATARAAAEVREAFGAELAMNHFQAVAPPSQRGEEPDPDDAIVILETFAKAANKWSAIQWVARDMEVPAARIAAIGNDVNDLEMLSEAGLGIAMGNAVPEARAVADRHTLSNVDDGVAAAIDRLLLGEW
jgi:hydroxymethylpyrimidine pyrophosphatase-like HAD family hydrolase